MAISEEQQWDRIFENDLAAIRSIIPARILENFATKYANAGAVYDRVSFRQSLAEAGLIAKWRKEFADRRTNAATSEGNHAQAS
jgi:hypothetical protein